MQKHEITFQTYSWWDPISLCADHVREPTPQQPTEELTQASLIAERFVVLAAFQTFCVSIAQVFGSVVNTFDKDKIGFRPVSVVRFC